MKKIIVVLSIGLLSLTKASAQHIHVKAGPEIGLNLTSLSERYSGYKYDNNIIPGLKVGGVVDISFNRMISLQPGLFFSMKGAAQKAVDYNYAGNTETIITYKDKIHINYMEVPVNLLFKVGYSRTGHFMFGGGPYLAFAVGGKITNQTTNQVNGYVVRDQTIESDLSIGNNSAYDDVRGTDVGFNFNGGYQWRRGLFVRGQVGFGMSNILPGGDGNNYMRNWGMGFTLGYLFGS